MSFVLADRIGCRKDGKFYPRKQTQMLGQKDGTEFHLIIAQWSSTISICKKLTQTELTSASCPKKVCTHLSVRTSHNLIHRSTEPVTMRFSSAFSDMEQTSPTCAGVWSSFLPASKSQTVIIISPDPVTILPSMECIH